MTPEETEFDVRTPSAETIQALKDARDRVGLTEYASIEDLKARSTGPRAFSTRKERPRPGS